LIADQGFDIPETPVTTDAAALEGFWERHGHGVHVVGDEVFACKVTSCATDYRYPRTEGEAPRIAPCDLPVELTERCRRLVASMSLLVAGIDLRLATDGRWFCFEVNPSPGFSYYEQEAEQPIADAIARLLTQPT
jgi:glutathione synthase/RimK-type ligase-like ATP-grasp enzyme